MEQFIDTMKLSKRTKNCLERANIKTKSDILDLIPQEDGMYRYIPHYLYPDMKKHGDPVKNYGMKRMANFGVTAFQDLVNGMKRCGHFEDKEILYFEKWLNIWIEKKVFKKDCKYCNEDELDLLTSPDNNVSVFIDNENNVLELYSVNSCNDKLLYKKTIKIKYCPVCGRKLEG